MYKNGELHKYFPIQFFEKEHVMLLCFSGPDGTAFLFGINQSAAKRNEMFV